MGATVRPPVSVSVADQNNIFCERFMAGVRDGKIPYDHYVSMIRGEPTPELVRVVNGQ